MKKKKPYHRIRNSQKPPAPVGIKVSLDTLRSRKRSVATSPGNHIYLILKN